MPAAVESLRSCSRHESVLRPPVELSCDTPLSAPESSHALPVDCDPSAAHAASHAPPSAPKHSPLLRAKTARAPSAAQSSAYQATHPPCSRPSTRHAPSPALLYSPPM